MVHLNGCFFPFFFVYRLRRMPKRTLSQWRTLYQFSQWIRLRVWTRIHWGQLWTGQVYLNVSLKKSGALYVYRTQIGYILFTDIDECALGICNNGSSCVNTDDSFLCVCGTGWTGNTCQEGNQLFLEVLHFYDLFES